MSKTAMLERTVSYDPSLSQGATGGSIEQAEFLEQCRDAALLLQPLDVIESIVARLKRIDISSLPGLRPLRVRVVASFTTSYLADYLRLTLLRRGFAPVIDEAPYGTLVAELMDPDNAATRGADLIVALPSHRDLQRSPPLGCTMPDADRAALEEAAFWASLLNKTAKPTIFLSFDAPRFRALAEQDGVVAGGLLRHVRKTNLELGARLAGSVALLDAEALQMRVGLERWHDERLYHLCKQPFAMEALPEIAESIAATAAGLFGRARKVLVLDLDNTLWGGVVGDVGPQGIVIGPETAEGEAFTAFQSYVKSLARRGIVLAVCSKNQEAFARAPFRENSHMVLREDDIACFAANFSDKPANIRQIAKTLNLGLDSMVMVDDSPVERALIARELPDVLVVPLGDDPSLYAASVEATKAFPLAALTNEDLERNKSYQAMAQVASAVASGTDMESFLKSLEPQMFVEPVAPSVQRIVQLIAKTNQFKLNPTLFTEAEILEQADSVLAMRLVDRLQDYGIVAIVVTGREGERLTIKNWVMSCRVFSRRMEHATMDVVRRIAAEASAREISAPYVPSPKNTIVPGMLEEVGFHAPADSDGILAAAVTSPHTVPDHFMKILDRRGGQ